MDGLRVGTFELRPAERVLCLDGRQIDLGARAFDMLLVLAETPGKLVTKATLLERVWPRLVVDENNLPAQIASLRRVLGAGAIRTVQGYGYRLELPVTRTADAASQSPTAGAQSTPAASRPLLVPRRSGPERLRPLVGRDEDLADVEAALARASLVTVTGIAGVGKTRLAQEVLVRAQGLPERVAAWAALAALDDVRLVPSAVAVALGISLHEGLDGFVALGQVLQSQRLLLVLDNAEHLAAGLAAPLEQLVSQADGLQVLVTSQAPLGIAGEVVVRLAPLAVAPHDAPAKEVAACAAVTLFAQRAADGDRRFALTGANSAQVAEICRRLDGIPLALELAAARAPALGLPVLLERLDDRFRLLKTAGRSTGSRHGTLHAAFDWSYGLMSQQEQRVFDRLGAFAGSFPLMAAADCVADEDISDADAVDLIGRLVDRSLVTVLSTDPPRYVLPETARLYARAQLQASGKLETARARMAATMLTLLDVAYDDYWSLDEELWRHRHAPDLDNVRAALEWSTGNDAVLAVSLYGSAWPLLVEMDLYAEGRARYPRVLECLRDVAIRERVARFWEALATYDSGRQYDRARYAAELAASMHTGNPRARYYALLLLAANSRGDVAATRAAFEDARSIERAGWPSRLLALGALTEGALRVSDGELEAARVAYERGMRIAIATSERQALEATVSVVELDIASGRIASALLLGRALVAGLHNLGRHDSCFDALVLVFSALLLDGQLAEARAVGGEVLDLALRMDAGKLFTALDAMAFLACLEGRAEHAARVACAADAAHDAHGQVRRRPVEALLCSAVTQRLGAQLGDDWRAGRGHAAVLDERSACECALAVHG